VGYNQDTPAAPQAQAGRGQIMWGWEVTVIRFVQNLGPWLELPMGVASFMGTVEFYLLAMPLLYWCWDNRLGLRLALMLVLTVGTNEALKMAFHWPRPYWVLATDQIRALSGEANFAFPSGHAQQAVSLWGLLASWLSRPRRDAAQSRPNGADERGRRWVWPAVLALIALNGLSRIYLGVHFASDVIVGWGAGALLLWAFLRWEGAAKQWLGQRTVGALIVVSLVASLALLGLTVGARASLGGWELPTSWSETALARSGEPIAPLNLKNAVDVAGVLLGVGAGAAWMARAGGFDPGGPVNKRLTRYALGLAGLLGVWFGLRAVFPEGESVTTYALRYGRSALVGAWVSAGAPALFVRVGLAERKG
jgi:membrane-associated phospholipid phosphatase